MNPETVLTMCNEKSIDINHVPGGSGAAFTSEDAKHALAHMNPAAFNYCMYVFLLNKNDLSLLMGNTVHYIVKYNPNIASLEKSKGLPFVIDLCRMACMEQIKPAGKITNKERYNRLKITRGEWRYKWKSVFVQAENYLNELRQEVTRHIYCVTKENE